MANESFSEFVKRCAESCNCNVESNTANQARVLIGKLAEKLDETLNGDNVINVGWLLSEEEATDEVKVTGFNYSGDDYSGGEYYMPMRKVSNDDVEKIKSNSWVLKVKCDNIDGLLICTYDDAKAAYFTNLLFESELSFDGSNSANDTKEIRLKMQTIKIYYKGNDAGKVIYGERDFTFTATAASD